MSLFDRLFRLLTPVIVGPLDGHYTHEHDISLGILSHTEYFGPPNDNVDRLWSDLYKSTLFYSTLYHHQLTLPNYTDGISVISANEATKLLNETVEVPDTPGQHVVQLHVFHALECVVSLCLEAISGGMA